ncbi:conserved hypothetical protein [Rubrivivax sp. A210]|uniref:hypothetical protein n=1 Tax=Rubrivivax sp. A210 TaxID=2772301 RepID=UPI0019980308|nr:hypothetical protein [Rubrivivax sp. A210]CAD5373724.1 conserved hypothetical protein [Rubrivivax sp. A210]
MTKRPEIKPWTWLMRWWQPPPARPAVPVSDRQRAQDLIRAVDAGGIPLNPARVNDIARRLGLEVSRHARVDETIARIRAALKR